MRDSADVRIVEVPADPSLDDPSAGVSPERTIDLSTAAPRTSLGAVQGSDAEVLYRVGGAFRLSDGRLAVANGGTFEVRYYGADGRHLASAGGEGDGPGEFRRFSWMGPAGGDSVAVFDGSQRRFTIFGPNGEYARDFRLDEFEGVTSERFPYPRYPVVLGRLASGDFVVAARATAGTGSSFTGIPDDSLQLYVAGPDGSIGDPVLVLPEDDRYVESTDGWVTMMPVPFGRKTSLATGANGIWVAPTHVDELRRYAPGGDPELIVRGARTPSPVQETDVEEYRRRSLADVDDPEWRERYEGILERMPMGEAHPLSAELHVDDVGRAWVRRATPEPDANPPWAVYGRDGTPLGFVRLPEGLRVYQVTADEIVGLRRDELEVERVETYVLPDAVDDLMSAPR